jgi:hypothetical protein
MRPLAVVSGSFFSLSTSWRGSSSFGLFESQPGSFARCGRITVADWYSLAGAEMLGHALCKGCPVAQWYDPGASVFGGIRGVFFVFYVGGIACPERRNKSPKFYPDEAGPSMTKVKERWPIKTLQHILAVRAGGQQFIKIFSHIKNPLLAERCYDAESKARNSTDRYRGRGGVSTL